MIIIKLNRWTVYPSDFTFRNNIFYIAGEKPSYFYGESTKIRFENNLYFGPEADNAPADKPAILSDPKFKNPGFGPKGYQLLPGSSALSRGMQITDNGGKDYFGKLLADGKKPNIGAME